MSMPPDAAGALLVDEQELRLVAALRAGDERAFADVVERHTPALLRVASAYVPSRAVAEEVVQDTWLAVLRGLDGFAQRSSFRTWLFHILVNIAKSRGVREHRTVPFSAVVPEQDQQTGPTVDPDRFRGPGDEWPRHWRRPPEPWRQSPEELALSAEVRAVLGRAVDALPERQRVVLTLRDVHGLPAEEVRAALDVSAANQRVLLHRARASVRQALADYLVGGER
jgi:RNA polymerase sigma-70 factor (ECF subfamily)